MDSQLRALQRRFQAGDSAVAGQLFKALLGAGQISNAEIDLLSLLGFYPAQEIRTFRYPNEYLWRGLGKHISIKLIIAAYSHIFEQLFNHHWCDVILHSDIFYWDREYCEQFRASVDAALSALHSWQPGHLPPLQSFRQLALLVDNSDHWHMPYGSRAMPPRNVILHYRDNSPEYWIIWHLYNKIGVLLQIREAMKQRFNYAHLVTSWLNDAERFWHEEMTNFELYTMPPETRPSQLLAQQQLYNYLLPHALELILI